MIPETLPRCFQVISVAGRVVHPTAPTYVLNQALPECKAASLAAFLLDPSNLKRIHPLIVDVVPTMGHQIAATAAAACPAPDGVVRMYMTSEFTITDEQAWLCGLFKTKIRYQARVSAMMCDNMHACNAWLAPWLPPPCPAPPALLLCEFTL